MNTMNVEQIKRSIHVDFLRLSASGKSSVWIFILLPFVFAVMGLISGDRGVELSMTGSVAGICALYAVLMGMMIFANEDMTGNISMNGILPVSRSNQVSARYALMAVFSLVAAVETVVCVVMLLHEDLPSPWVMAGIGCGVLFVALLLGGLVVPIFYRFPITQAMGWAFGGLGALFLLVFMVVRFMPNDKLHRVVEWVTTTKLGAVPWAAIIGAVICVVVFVGSLLISSRIYRRKELS
ncbi:ABC-2 transporter permease [Bifidobacterium sp. ESL0790]|uniref:ABC-2 transporter permease n=1 Tax=Bifidobacterium sp. ESL0790 TaxID=2983233 RepID=UPI0023F73F28|nr:ABC-2 transporter permease [Bifidobacterium sp. ESL0790]WEV71787.1 ABC-2 transporter permease [Bifidobacterium sp. ESL0790]